MRLLSGIGDASVARSIELCLAAEGFKVEQATEGEEVLDLAKLYDFDLVILGDELEEDNWLWVLRQMRMQKVTTPAMILSRESGRALVVEALNAGADDFLPMPFHKDELVARLHAIIRRSRGHAASTIEVGPMTIDLDAKTVAIGPRRIHLTGKEYQMFELLAVRRGMTLTKEAFLNHLYGGRDEPELKIVDVFICKLRKKLIDACGANFIETVWGRGYVLRDEPVPDRDTKGGVATHSDKVDPLSTRRGLVLRELLNGPMTVQDATTFLGAEYGSVATSMLAIYHSGHSDRNRVGRRGEPSRYTITPKGRQWLVDRGADLGEDEPQEQPVAA